MKLFAAFVVFAAAVSGQGIKVQAGGRPIAARGTLDLEPGFGILQTCRDDAANDRVVCSPAFNSATIPTHETIHNNENYCVSTNGTTAYTCKLPNSALTSYQAGMAFVLVTDATCSSSCSLNIDLAGRASLKRSDGATDPGGALIAGQPQWVFYDGKVFRLMGGGGGGAPAPEQLTSGTDRHDSIARRFIASMESMTYARTVMLETTAGDVHKTTTSNAVGNATIDAATPGLPGQHMWLIITNDELSAKTVAFGKNFRSAGPLTGSPGKTATLQFVSDGYAWYEVARTRNL